MTTSIVWPGALNKALQAAYNELLEAVQKGNEKAIEKAVEVAVNEKSRYVAERITRTEMARAWADGFVAKMKTDADIVAVKFKLSSRHPVFISAICTPKLICMAWVQAYIPRISCRLQMNL